MIELDGNAQYEWQVQAFGPEFRPQGIIDHIRKECDEILADPTDPVEWIDIIFLALNGLKAQGFSDYQISQLHAKKLTKNINRTWPDWRTADPNKAIEHVRT